MRVDVYTWQDAYVATIGPDALLAFTHTDELNGEDSVAITTTFPLKQGYRLVWKDGNGTAHEHICQDPKGLHSGGETLYTDTALNSICELYGDFIEDRRPYSYSFLKALNVALEPTRWEAGEVDQPGSVSSGLTFYHTSAREALQDILECGGELETTVSVGAAGTIRRKVGIRQHRGSSSGHRRFSYSKDLVSVSRTEHFSAVTACYGYGKGEETDSGGYGRKLTFGSINGGLNYVADKEALAKYGRPDGDGGFAHVFGTYENSDCEDASQLLSETRAYLDEHSEPGMTYECSVVDLVQFGRDWEGVAVGDDVQVVDKEFSPELRLEGRVSKLVTDELGGSQTVTIGNVADTMADMLTVQQQAVSSLSRRSSNWDVAANTPAAYLQQVIDGLNEQFNAAGGSYSYTSFTAGTIWSSVPLDEDGKPTKTGGCALQLCSEGFRMASGTKADGSYDWTTFGTGGGFVANKGTFSSVDAGLIDTGRLSVSDKSTGEQIFYADIDDGSVYIGGATVNIGGDTVDAAIKAAGGKYGYCYTAAATAEKVVSVDDFELKKGASVSVRFSYANTASSPKLNVSNTGAKSIAYAGYGYLLERYWWKASDVLTFTYDGSSWQLADGGSRKNARSNWASDTTSVDVAAGRVTFNAGTFVLNASNMTVSSSGTVTAKNFTATGSFTGGSKTSGYGMELTTGGRLTGYRNGTKYGYIDCSANSYDVTDPSIVYNGLQLQADGIIRVTSPKTAVKDSKNVGDTATYGYTGSYYIVGRSYGGSWDSDLADFYLSKAEFVNGICTCFPS